VNEERRTKKQAQEIHWANQYIGLPWSEGAEGPDAFDCYGLFRVVQRNYFGIDMPPFGEVNRENLLSVIRAIRRNPENRLWEKIGAPEEGCLVKMAKADTPDHLGIWIDVDGGGVLHSTRAHGVCFDDLLNLTTMGWRGITYYRRVPS